MVSRQYAFITEAAERGVRGEGAAQGRACVLHSAGLGRQKSPIGGRRPAQVVQIARHLGRPAPSEDAVSAGQGATPMRMTVARHVARFVPVPYRNCDEFGARAASSYRSPWHGVAHSCSVHHHVTRPSRPLTSGMAASNPISSRA